MRQRGGEAANRGVDIPTRQLEAPGEEERLAVTGLGEVRRNEARASEIWKLLWWRKDRQPVISPSTG
jgi:hypothetical protein